MKKEDKKAYLQMSFQWIFAIVVGGFILFLAIYVSVKYIGQEESTLDAKTGKEIGVLLNPLETGFESARVTSLILPVETRIYNKCSSYTGFGKQTIQVSQKSLNTWTDTNIDVNFKSKYIFSEVPIEGKKFSVFSKPFNFPFKIADLIYMIPAKKTYCFRDAPEDIQEELEDLQLENILFEECLEESISVCFGLGADCDIEVNLGRNFVEKGESRVYYDKVNREGNALMYAAIFSEPTTYECQIKRLMGRLEVLITLYKEKSVFVSRTGCNSNLDSELTRLASLIRDFEGSQSLYVIGNLATEIEEKNGNNMVCRLW